MFIIKVFLIFSYSSVKYDALPPPPPGHFHGVSRGHSWPRFLSAGSPAAVLVCCGVKPFNLHGIHSKITIHIYIHTHMYVCVCVCISHDLRNRTAVGLHMKVLFKGLLPVWRHAHACLCFAPARQCICFTVKLDLNTWSPRALKTAGQRCQQKPTRLPGPSVPTRSARLKARWSLIWRFGFYPVKEDPLFGTKNQRWSLFTIFKCNFSRQLFQFGHNSVYLCKNTSHLWANLLFKPQAPPL